jgi:hypothetical protein
VKVRNATQLGSLHGTADDELFSDNGGGTSVAVSEAADPIQPRGSAKS